MTFDELITKIKEDLKSMLNKDNTEVITKLDKNIDELVVSHQAVEKKLSDTVDLYINQMKSTGFKTPQGDNKQPEEITEEDAWEAAIKRGLEEDEKANAKKD